MLALARVSGSGGGDVAGITDLDTEAVLSCDRGKVLEENLCGRLGVIIEVRIKAIEVRIYRCHHHNINLGSRTS